MSDKLPETFAALAERLEGVRPIDDTATLHMLRVHGVEIGRVRPRGDDGFEFDETRAGPQACWIADGDRHEQVVAWQPERPDKLRYLDGDRPPYVGCWHLDRASICRRPLHILPDIEAWLKAGRDGVVIVDWSRFDPHSDLVGIPEVYCPSEAVKSRLEAAFRPRLRITIRQSEGIRNAA